MGNLAMTDSKKYYQQKLEHTDEWDVLDQGGYMTNLRHKFVIGALASCEASTVLDYGCGGGMIFENEAFNPEQFSNWHGVDFIEERRESFMTRMLDASVPGTFRVVHPEGDYVEYVLSVADAMGADTVVLCGVLGYQGFTDLHKLIEAKNGSLVRNVIVTVPVTTPEYNETVIHRFDPAMVRALFHACVEISPGLMGVVL